jgi:hypothetical protein
MRHLARFLYEWPRLEIEGMSWNCCLEALRQRFDLADEIAAVIADKSVSAFQDALQQRFQEISQGVEGTDPLCVPRYIQVLP